MIRNSGCSCKNCKNSRGPAGPTGPSGGGGNSSLLKFSGQTRNTENTGIFNDYLADSGIGIIQSPQLPNLYPIPLNRTFTTLTVFVGPAQVVIPDDQTLLIQVLRNGAPLPGNELSQTYTGAEDGIKFDTAAIAVAFAGIPAPDTVAIGITITAPTMGAVARDVLVMLE